MADITCPACGKIIKGEHRLSLHSSRWCTKNISGLADLLQQHCNHIQNVAKEEERQFDAPNSTEDIERGPSGLPICNCHLPHHYRDELPSISIPVPAPAAVQEPALPSLSDVDASRPSDDITMDHDSSTSTSSSSGIIYVCTESDGNNLFQQYQSNFPSYNPENTSSLDQLCDGQAFQHSDPAPSTSPLDSQLPVSLHESYFTPFLNATI
ncbi:hypothetical protein J3R82DRAFT_6791 [Butyriboletus roseoflavus]|nr:hypothetical protein J3R82DRAFT_6791 [Butyriboletus roseoflavus]